MPKTQVLNKKKTIQKKPGKKFTCPVCKKEIGSSTSFKYHLTTHNQNRTKDYHCECGKSFYSQQKSEEHRRVHSEPEFKCDHCGKMFTQKSSILTHMKSHSNDRPYQCRWPHCSKKFKLKNSCDRHYLTHAKLKKYICTWNGCTNSFLRKDQLQTHLEFHNAIKKYFCTWENCTSSFITKLELNVHYKSHTKPFLCSWPECKKKFSKQSGLVEHMCSHTGERPFKCNSCEKSFVRKTHLKKHIDACHLEIKNFKCDFPGCEYKANRSSHVKIHNRIHTGEKPYTCSIASCSKTFAFYSNWREHEQIYHLGRCVKCIASGQKEDNAPFVHFKFANDGLPCAQFKYGMEVAFRMEYQLANYIQNRFANHPQIRQILFNKTDPDDQSCSLFRPDVRILTHTLGDAIIECDENSHKPYLCTMKDIQTSWSTLQVTRQSSQIRKKIKEDSRLSEIVMTGTIEKTVVWRFNPDRYRNERQIYLNDNQVSDEFGNITILSTPDARKIRFETLGNDIQNWLDGRWDMEKLPFIHVVYFFYDGPVRQESFVPVDGDEYKKWLEELKSKV